MALAAGAAPVLGQAHPELADRPAVRGLAGGRRPLADPGLRPLRAGRTLARQPRHPDHLRAAGHGDRHRSSCRCRWSCASSYRCSRRSATEQEQAADTPRRHRWQGFCRITLPAIRWALAYGVVLSLARALGEFGAVASSPGTSWARPRPSRSSWIEHSQNFDSGRRLRRPRSLLALVAVARAHRRSACCAPRQRHADGHRVRNVSKCFGDFLALDDVSVDIDGSADRAARAERRRQVHAAADHRRPGAPDTGTVLIDGDGRHRRCPPQRRTSASCSSTTPRSST